MHAEHGGEGALGEFYSAVVLFASANYRKDIARALTSATPALLAEGSGAPGAARIRRALMRWGFNAKQRGDAPADVAAVLAWVARNSSPVSAVSEPAAVRRMLEAATTRIDGTLPPLVWNAEIGQWQEPPEDDDWGELHLRSATPDAGAEWTDDGKGREVRPLKHRAEDDTRTVPVCPELTTLLRVHLREL